MSLFKKKKFSKEYHNLIKRNNKKLVKLAKETRPWDYSWGIELLVLHLEYMKEYYSNRENVVALENYEWDPKAIKKSRLEMIQDILSEYYAWRECDDKYTKVIFKNEDNAKEKVDNLIKEGYHLKEENEDSCLKDCYFLYLYDDYHINIKEMSKEYALHRKNFFNLLNKYIEELWD